MKKIKILLFMLSAWATGIAQCSFDTVSVSGSPGVGMQTDTLTEPMLPCWPYNCKATYCHSWQLPQNFTGHLELFSNTTSLLSLNIQIWEDCHYVRFETCTFVAQQNIQDWDTILDFPDNAQVVVCNSNEPITIVIKPGPATDTLPPAFLYVDTLCGALLPVEIPASPEEPTYVNPSTGIEHGLPLPAGLWIRRWPGTLKPSDLIHVRPH
jgi:hypothetical protein